MFVCRHLACLILEGVAGNVERTKLARCPTSVRKTNKQQCKQLKISAKRPNAPIWVNAPITEGFVAFAIPTLDKLSFHIQRSELTSSMDYKHTKTQQLTNAPTHQLKISSTQQLKNINPQTQNSSTHKLKNINSQTQNSSTHKLKNSSTHKLKNSSTQKLKNHQPKKSQAHQPTNLSTHQPKNSKNHQLKN